MLSRLDKDVAWRRIADDIANQIDRRELKPGAKLETELAYARAYKVNRHTVRRALAALKDRGVVEVTQGRGSFVCRPPLEYRVTRSSLFDEIVDFESVVTGRREPSYRVQRAKSDIAEALAIKGGSEVIAIEKVGYAHQQPVALSSHFISLKSDRDCDDFITAFEGGASIGEAFAECGVERASRRTLDIKARLATPLEMRRLDLPKHAPLLVADAVILDQAETPIEFNRALLASDRVRIRIAE